MAAEAAVETRASGPVTGVVWVGSEVLAEPRSGGHLRTARLLTALARRASVEVVTTGPSSPPDELESAFPITAAYAFHGPSSGLMTRRTALVRRWPLAVARTWSEDAARLVDDKAKAGNRIVLDFVTSGAYRPSSGQVIYSLHNAEAARLRGLPRPETWRGRAERRYEQLMTQRWERSCLADPSARIVAVSAHDAALLGVDADVVPNGTDVPADPGSAPVAGPLLFVGSLDYAPNLDAVTWWSREVWPLLSPDLTLHVVGRRGALRTTPDGVRLLGEVPDVAPHLAAAALVVVPLRSGGGTRLKILEAMAWQRAVVTTSKGAEGLDAALLDAVELADRPADIAAKVIALLADVPRRAALGEQARTAVRSYDWSLLGDRFADIVLS
ncbi:MAG: polysaccharide biosynthesis protein PslH [Actinomycetota bacterium]|jgi:glycosyltransferase involved in cell wall biosynthesis|nr:polysaccharide biosynthesis protein PslH [Actinomycetota bacterium]